MAISLEDVETLFGAVKLLRDERRKMAKLSEKARLAPLGRPSQKASVDLVWQGHHVSKLELAVHAVAVDCGLADLRSPEHYQPYSVKLTGFHEYEVVPPKPRALSCQGKLDSSAASKGSDPALKQHLNVQSRRMTPASPQTIGE